MFNKTQHLPNKCTNYWEKQLETQFTDVQWKHFFSICQIEPNPRIQSFQYSIIHRYFPCNYYLSKWKVEHSANCDTCNTKDDILHYFYNCQLVRGFWQEIQNWIRRKTKSNFELNEQNTTLGIFTKGKNTDALNFLILQAKWFIYKQKKSGEKIHFYKFIENFKNRIEVERQRYALKEKQDLFINKFELFKEIK